MDFQVLFHYLIECKIPLEVAFILNAPTNRAFRAIEIYIYQSITQIKPSHKHLNNPLKSFSFLEFSTSIPTTQTNKRSLPSYM